MKKFIVTKNELVAETLKGLGYFFVKHDCGNYFFINKQSDEALLGIDKKNIAYTDILSI